MALASVYRLPATCSWLSSGGSSAARLWQLSLRCFLSCPPLAAFPQLCGPCSLPCVFSQCRLPSRVSLAALPLQLAIRVLSAARSSQRDTGVSAVQLALRVFWAQLPALCRLPSARSSAARPFPLPLRVSSAQLPAPCSLHCVFCPPLAACHPSFVSCPLFAACIACFLSTASAPCSFSSDGSSTVRLLQLAIYCVSSPVAPCSLPCVFPQLLARLLSGVYFAASPFQLSIKPFLV